MSHRPSWRLGVMVIALLCAASVVLVAAPQSAQAQVDTATCQSTGCPTDGLDDGVTIANDAAAGAVLVDAYDCGVGFSGEVGPDDGAFPVTLEYILMPNSGDGAEINLGSFQVVEAGAYTSPEGFVDPILENNEDYDVTIVLLDNVGQSVRTDNVFVAEGRFPCTYEPAIGVAKALVGAPTLNGAGNHELTYSFVIENLGNTPLRAIQLTDGFAAAFAPDGTVVGGPTPNGGTCSAEAANGTATLPVGESCVAVWDIEVSGLILGETYNNVAAAAGRLPEDLERFAAEETKDITDDSVDGANADPNDDGNPEETSPTPATIPVPDKAVLGDKVFNDANGNGIQDLGEAGVAGVKVQIRGTDGAVREVTTDADGLWSVLLEPGDYDLSFVLPPGFAFAPKDVGDDDTVDSDVNPSGIADRVTLAAGDVNTTVDAGLVPLGSIGGRAWDDANKDGLQDAGEVGFAGVEVILHSANDDGTKGGEVERTTTDADGNYVFGALSADDYLISVSAPTGRTITTQDAGDDDAADSDIDVLTGDSTVVTLGIGEEDLSLDIGFATVTPEPTATPEPTSTPEPTNPTTPRVDSDRFAPALPGPGAITNAPGSTSTPAAAESTPTQAPLATTGSNSNVLVTLAIAMLGAGGTMWIGARRGEQ